MTEEYSFDINHIFIYSSTNRHLRCFHILAIVNNSAVHISFKNNILFSSDKYLGVESLDGCFTQFFDEPPYSFQW